jgi:hypothetical protein
MGRRKDCPGGFTNHPAVIALAPAEQFGHAQQNAASASIELTLLVLRMFPCISTRSHSVFQLAAAGI